MHNLLPIHAYLSGETKPAQRQCDGSDLGERTAGHFLMHIVKMPQENRTHLSVSERKKLCCMLSWLTVVV